MILQENYTTVRQYIDCYIYIIFKSQLFSPHAADSSSMFLIVVELVSIPMFYKEEFHIYETHAQSQAMLFAVH